MRIELLKVLKEKNTQTFCCVHFAPRDKEQEACHETATAKADSFVKSDFLINKTPKVVSVGCVGLWKHNGFLSRLMEQKKTKHPLALWVEPRVTKFDKVPMF